MDKEKLINSVSDIEQRSFIKIGLLLDLPGTSTHKQLAKALGTRALPLRTVNHWLHQFREGRTQIEDQKRGRSDVTVITDQFIEQIRDKVQDGKSWSAN
jgi:hypothetical protein